MRDYSLLLAPALYGYGKLMSLQRNIFCKSVKPKFIMRPQCIEFKKKVVMNLVYIITQIEKCYASFQDLQITNPENRVLHWKIDTQSLSAKKVFAISPSSGRIDGGQSIIIKVHNNGR